MGLLFKKCLLLLKHCANFSQSPPHAFKHNLLDPLELKNFWKRKQRLQARICESAT